MSNIKGERETLLLIVAENGGSSARFNGCKSEAHGAGVIHRVE